MADLETLKALLERVEKARKPSAEISARIVCALLAPPGSSTRFNDNPIIDMWVVVQPPGPLAEIEELFCVVSNGRPENNVTASVDAALGLVEGALPGAEFEISTLYGITHVSLPLNDDGASSATRQDGKLPLAICAALLRALIAKKEADNG